MRYLLIALLILAPLPAVALTGGSARFDFRNGQPSIVDNQTSLCTGQTTVRYDFTAGQPAQIFDTTATCTAAAAVILGPPTLLIKGSLQIKGGVIVK